MSFDLEEDLKHLELRMSTSDRNTLYRNLYQTGAALLIHLNNALYLKDRDLEVRTQLYDLLKVMKTHD